MLLNLFFSSGKIFSTKLFPSEFKRNFLCYNLDEYDKSYKKILLIEDRIIKNKEKIDNIKKNLNSTKKTNKEILTRVKKLNSQKKTLQ